MPASAVSSLRNSAVTFSRSLKVGTTTDSSGVVAVCCEVPCPGRMASFMGLAYIAGRGSCQGERARGEGREPKTDQTPSKNANDHEQQARVHPALPYYSVVVPT